MTHLSSGRLRWLARFLLIATLLAACQQKQEAGNGATSAGGGYGGITATIVWPAQAGLTALSQPLAAPAGVTTVVLKVTGADMSLVSASFPAAAGAGSVGNVPAGSNRTLAVEGRNSSNALIYLGATIVAQVIAGQTANAGIIAMGDVSTFSAPGDVTVVSAIAGDKQVTLTWTLAADTSTQHTRSVMIRRSATPFTLPIAAGTAPSQGTLVSDGYGTSATVTGLTNGTLVYFALFAHDMVPNYAGGVSTSATPVAPGTNCVWDTSTWDNCSLGP